MPIFEYKCEPCGEEFELIVFPSTVIECPKCGNRDVKKKLSIFGMSGVENPGTGESGCGPCSKSSCSSCK